jgi:Flp pilus assembly protein TadG
MTGILTLPRRLRADDRGATIVELAFVTPALILVLLGLTDLGYNSYLGSVVQGTVQKAARRATVGNQTSAQIDEFVRNQLTHFSKNATVAITKTSYYQFSGVGKSEKLTKDLNGNGSWDSGDCYEDAANFGVWDAIAGSDGLGGSDDIVYYKVTVDFPRLMPLGTFMGWSATERVSATTIMRNQPYGSQIVPSIRGGTSMSGNCST